MSERSYYGAEGIDNMSALYPRYARDLKVWECPAARNVVRRVEDLKENYNAYTEPRYGGAYEYFPFMFQCKRQTVGGKTELDIDWGGTVSLIKWSKLRRMSDVSVTWDCDDLAPNNEIGDGDPHWALRGGNMQYADGHARWVRAELWPNAILAGRPIVK
jgi:prepilin-type processing-associated H-X9-DG protein